MSRKNSQVVMTVQYGQKDLLSGAYDDAYIHRYSHYEC